MTELFEVVGETLDAVNTELTQNRVIYEALGGVRGFVTVIHKSAATGIETVLCEDKDNLLTNGGRDWIHNQAYTNTATGTRGAGYIALSADTGAPAAGDTTLAGEIVSGGFARADAGTKTHTNGTNTTTISNIFTASSIQTAIVKTALFNASSVGIMVHENTFTTVTCQIGDTLTVIWTITAG